MAQQDSGSTSNQGGDKRNDQDLRDQNREWRHERRYHDPMRGLFWGLILILLGVLLFAAMQDWLPWDRWWQLFLIGLGVIFLIDALVRYISPAPHFGVFGRVITGIILIVIGIAFLFSMEQWWPLILIAIGAAILVRFLVYKR